MNFGALSRGFGTCCLRFKNGVTTIPAKLASGWLARLYREGVEPSGSLQKVSDHIPILLFWLCPGAREVSWRFIVLAARQAHREDRPLARLARHGHVAAHHARELAGDGKAEPGAAELLRGCGVGLAELLEQLSLLLRSHANASVSDRELDPVATVGDPARPQPDLAFLGELAGIAQQVEQYLPQSHGVHGQCA